MSEASERHAEHQIREGRVEEWALGFGRRLLPFAPILSASQVLMVQRPSIKIATDAVGLVRFGLYKPDVAGSSPVPPTQIRPGMQRLREGGGKRLYRRRAAQVVEHSRGIENAKVAPGPSLG